MSDIFGDVVMIELLNIDCMDYMASCPDKKFDLAIVDPPYGIGIDVQKLNNTNKNKKHNRKEHAFKRWDSEIPDKKYFDELFRVSKNQIIWGGNYFIQYLTPTKAWIFWYKGQNDLTMSDGEMAWTSLNVVTRQVTINRAELIKQNTFHPTEKPIKLYRWLLDNYAKTGNLILDTHAGSFSSAVACKEKGFDGVFCELDKEYFDAGKNRVDKASRQYELLKEDKIILEQPNLL